jgi:predicted Abi (CAAX) family protease
LNAARRLRDALLTWPSARLWLRAFGELIWLAPVLAVLAWVGDLTDPASAPELFSLARLAAVAFFVPAMAEEIVFRVILLPAPSLRAPFWRCALATVLFVLWHPVQVLFFSAAWAQVVWNPVFLIAVAALGFALTRLYLATRSAWPPVVLHWLVVVAWKALGGPSPWG